MLFKVRLCEIVVIQNPTEQLPSFARFFKMPLPLWPLDWVSALRFIFSYELLKALEVVSQNQRNWGIFEHTILSGCGVTVWEGGEAGPLQNQHQRFKSMRL